MSQRWPTPGKINEIPPGPNVEAGGLEANRTIEWFRNALFPGIRDVCEKDHKSFRQMLIIPPETNAISFFAFSAASRCFYRPGNVPANKERSMKNYLHILERMKHEIFC